MNNNFPRVLLISHNALSDIQNNGKTLSAFFENYPKECIAQLFFTYEDPSYRVCDNFFQITDLDIFKKIIFKSNLVGRELRSFYENIQNDKDDLSNNIFYSIIREGFRRDFIIFDLIRNWFWNTQTWKSDKFFAWLNRFKPDVIFFQGSHLQAIYQLVLDICNKWNIPLILQITDDYVCPAFSFNPFWWIKRLSLSRIFKKAVKRSEKIVVIGDRMKEEYSERFGGNYYVAMNCCEPKCLSQEQVGKKIVFVYAGNLGLNRWKTLHKFAQICARDDFLNNKIEIQIYTLQNLSKPVLNKLNQISFMHFKGAATSEQLSKIRENANILLHIESFDRKNKVITKYSVSTKIPEIFYSNRCLLCIGPDDVASVMYIKENNFGVTITSLNENEVIPSIKKIVTDSDLRSNYAKRAYDAALNLHSLERTQYDVKEIILKAVQARNPEKRKDYRIWKM